MTYAYARISSRDQNLDRLCLSTINTMLRNIIYLGHMPQLMSSSVSYKNHKRYKKDKSEWVIVYNTHEPIISQELWDRVEARRSSLAQGRKRLKTGFTHPLSGFLICADCGCKMKQNTSVHGNKRFYSFNCGDHMRFGKSVCFSHHIMAKDIEAVILGDIREMAQRIVLDEEQIKGVCASRPYTFSYAIIPLLFIVSIIIVLLLLHYLQIMVILLLNLSQIILQIKYRQK